MSAHTEAEVCCDGPTLAVGQFPCGTPSIFAVTATQARQWAREAGWRVNIPIPGSSRRGDQCPECRKASNNTPEGETR